MAVSKSKKQSKNSEDIDLLKSDVASFASSLGLSSSLPSSGFNDADFRKTGSLRRHKPEKKPKQSPIDQSESSEKPINRNLKSNEKPKTKPPIISLEGMNDRNLGFETFKNLPKLPLMKASALGVWYADAEELEAKVIGKEKRVDARNLDEWKGFVEKKRELGGRLMAQYAKDYEASRGQSGDIRMLYTTLRSGTVEDRVSACSVLIGDNPVANLRSLDNLLGMVTSKVGKHHAFKGFDTLKELFISSLLPDHKLKSLLQRPLNHISETKDGYSLLLLWYWEDCLKQRYERFVFALEEASRDVLRELKAKALKIIYTLLSNKSEQERRLLSALVNKLGDPDKNGATASNAAYQLTRLLSQSEHPNMKAVVIDEVDSFLFRPHLGFQAKYHAVNFLSQIHLSHKGDGPKVAKRLVDIYFALFKVLITEAGSGVEKRKNAKPLNEKASKKHGKETKKSSESHAELDSRLLSALLMGVNRAFPFVSTSEADDTIETQTPMLFQLVHSENFNVGIQALMLLHKITSKNQVASDRFYRALYAKLLLPAAMNSSKAEMFIGLLLRAMKSDVNLKRVAAFAKRLMQVALQQPPQYSCGCLFLLSEVLKSRPALSKMVRQSEAVDEEDEHFEDIVEENDNEPKSFPSDQENDIQPVENGGADVSDGGSSEESDDSPIFASDDEASDGEDEFILREDPENVNEPKGISGSNRQQSQVSSKSSTLPGGYNPRHREPSYSNADRASWWELTALASHVHPSVSNWANRLLLGSDIIYNGNPLHDLSLTAFLDKFMEKKPKSSTWHGGSQIEPAKKLEMTSHLIGPEILTLADEDVPPEDLVFHKFYMNKQSSAKKPKKKKKKKRSADDEAAEELFGGDGGDDESDNEEIDNMLDSTNLSAEADGEYDYDDLDRVAEEDDDDLVGNISDDGEGMDVPSDTDIGEEDFDPAASENQSDDDNIVNVGEEDDGDFEEDDLVDRPMRKRKPGKSGASPFASLEDYEHLLNDGDISAEEEPAKKKPKKSKSRRKRKSSD